MFGTNYFENSKDVLSVGYNQGEMIELFTSHCSNLPIWLLHSDSARFVEPSLCGWSTFAKHCIVGANKKYREQKIQLRLLELPSISARC